MSGPKGQGGLYVGYLPLPRAHRAFLAIALPAIMLAFIGGAALIAGAQRDPGDAVWETGEERTWTGVLVAYPHPTLYVDGTAHLLAEMGKSGPHARGIPEHPVQARIRGYPLAREGRLIIELAPDEGAISVVSNVPPNTPTRASLGPATIRGEIIDGKCFLGAMKPGDGKAHKACAILCIEGGLPPMVAVRDDPADPTPAEVLLLLVDGSTDLPREVLDLVAQPVVITGERTRIGTLGIIDAHAADIRPAP